MNPLTRIDDWLISRFEAFSHWTQRAIGVTSARWAQACYAGAGFCAAYRLVGEGSAVWKASFGISVGICVFGYVRAALRKPQAGEDATANVRKVEDRVERVLSLLVAVVRVLLVPELIGWFEFALLGLYFSACDDLPLAPSKLRQWLDSLSATPETAEGAA
jgi:hypothetical protein